MIKQKACELEPQTIKFVKSGFANDEISAHLHRCASCRETAKVVAFFQTNLKNETSALPAAGFVFWKSKIIEKRRLQERVAQPILAAQTAAAVTVFATALWFLISKPAPLAAAFDALAPVQSLAASLLVGVATFSLVCLLFALVLRRYFTEK